MSADSANAGETKQDGSAAPAGSAAPPATNPPSTATVVPRLSGRDLWVAAALFAYLAVSATVAGSKLLTRSAVLPAGPIVGLPDALRKVAKDHCVVQPVPSQAPPTPTPSAASTASTAPGDSGASGSGAPGTANAPKPASTPAPQLVEVEVCGPLLVRGLLSDGLMALVLIGIVGGALSGLWSLVVYIGNGTFESPWSAYYLLRPLAGAVAAPSILFGLDLLQLKPGSVQVCVFMAFLASVAVQYYMKKLFDLSRTLFHTDPNDQGESKGTQQKPAKQGGSQ